jgi:hypothetical protein
MKSLAFLFLLALASPAAAAGGAALLGTWEAARGTDDERLFLRLLEKGKAEIVSEYDFQLPGQPGKRRGRSTTFGKWSVKGNSVVLTYAKVKDQLVYDDRLPLGEVGLEGTSAGLKPIGKIDPKSRIRAILWKAPHEYKLKAPDLAGAAGQVSLGAPAPSRSWGPAAMPGSTRMAGSPGLVGSRPRTATSDPRVRRRSCWSCTTSACPPTSSAAAK